MQASNIRRRILYGMLHCGTAQIQCNNLSTSQTTATFLGPYVEHNTTRGWLKKIIKGCVIKYATLTTFLGQQSAHYRVTSCMSHRESVCPDLRDVELLEPFEPDEGVVHDGGDGVAREGEGAQVVHRLPRRVGRA